MCQPATYTSIKHVCVYVSHMHTHTAQDAPNSPEEETGLERLRHKPETTQWVWMQTTSLHSLPWSPEQTACTNANLWFLYGEFNVKPTVSRHRLGSPPFLS